MNQLKTIKYLIQKTRVEKITGSADDTIYNLQENSKLCNKGSLFFAKEGIFVNGLEYVEEAIQNGAHCIVSEKPLSKRYPYVCWVQVQDIYDAMSRISSRFYDYPEKKIDLIGVTGTNGKTTTAFMIHSLFKKYNVKCGKISTVENCGDSFSKSSSMTTPSILELKHILSEMVMDGCEWAVIEVSSHALNQKRVHDLRFRGAVFTNLTQDHLDYHGTMDSYYLSKSMLFHQLCHQGWGVINTDDIFGQKLKTQNCHRLITDVGFNSDAKVLLSHPYVDIDGSSVRIAVDDISEKISLKILGKHNLMNASMSFAAGWNLGMEPYVMLNALQDFEGVPGRMNVYYYNDRMIVIDYAHTPDALDHVLKTLRPLSGSNLWTVMGCGGNRDVTKRPLMGQIAARWSEKIILTNDNPRYEDPDKIFQDIQEGIQLKHKSKELLIQDRSQAIEYAIENSKAGDIIAIVGKGHETYQEKEGIKLPFSDHSVVTNYFKKKNNKETLAL